MISSMTGYGKGVVEFNDFVIEAEIKSFNSRYLDLSVKMPRTFLQKEFEIREIIKKRIKRGKLYFSLHINKGSNGEKELYINPEGLQNAVSILEEIKHVGKISDKLTLDNLLTLQNMYFTDSVIDPDEDFEHIEKAVNIAIDELIIMRDKEGEQLSQDLINRVDGISNALDEIEKQKSEVVVEYFEKLKSRAKQLVSDIAEYDDRLKMELALLAEKYDITEECVRLRSHMKMFRDSLNDSKEAGRRLNFITQEMNREANTINSKSVSTEVTNQGIFIKEELEKIREQIQNIE